MSVANKGPIFSSSNGASTLSGSGVAESASKPVPAFGGQAPTISNVGNGVEVDGGGQLVQAGAEELDEEINEDGHGVVPFGVDRCEHFER